MKKILNFYLFISLICCGSTFSTEWETIEIPLNEAITGIDVISKDTIHLVTTGGKHGRSFDGGKSWGGKFLSIDVPMEDVHFIDGLKGIVCGRKGIVWTTYDGGQSWNDCKWPDTNAIFISARMLDENTLIAVGFVQDGSKLFPGIAIHSSDGGKNWEKVRISGRTIGELFIDANGDLYCLSLGFYNKSTDRGKTWTSTRSVIERPGRLITFHNDIGIIVGNLGLIAFSSDHGKTWEETSILNDQQHMTSAVIYNDTLAFACGTESGLYFTADGGKTWTIMPIPKTANILGLDIHKNHLYAIGSDGMIIRREIE